MSICNTKNINVIKGFASAVAGKTKEKYHESQSKGGIKKVIAESNKRKSARSPQQVMASSQAMFNLINGDGTLISDETNRFKQFSSFNDLIKERTGSNPAELQNRDLTSYEEIQISKTYQELANMISLAKIDERHFASAMRVLGEENDSLTERAIKQELFFFQKHMDKEKHRTSFNQGANWLYSKVSSVIMNKKIYNALSNMNLIYKKFAGEQYSRSDMLDNQTERSMNMLLRGFRSLTDFSKYQFINHDFINKYFHLTAGEYVEGAKPGQDKNYEELKRAISNEVGDANGSLHKLQGVSHDEILAEALIYRKKFDKYNYGIDENETLWWDTNRDALVVKDANGNTTPYLDGLRNYSEKAHYKSSMSSRGESVAYKIFELGNTAAQSISRKRILFAKETNFEQYKLSELEKQIISKFGTEEQRTLAGVKAEPFHLRVGYAPTMMDNPHKDFVGGLDLSGIPTIRYLKTALSKHKIEGNFFEAMSTNLSLSKRIYSDFSRYELHMDTKRRFIEGDPSLKNLERFEIDMLKERMESDENHFNQNLDKSGMVRAVASVLGSISTLVGSSMLMKPSSALTNYASGKLIALMNRLDLPGLNHTEVTKYWKQRLAMEGSDSMEREVANYIDIEFDRIAPVASRKEAAIHVMDNRKINDVWGKLREWSQRFSDITADYGLFSELGFFDEVVRNKEGFRDNRVVSFFSQRKSEAKLRNGFSKGIAHKLTMGVLEQMKKDGKLKGDSSDYVTALSKVLGENTEFIHRLEGETYGDFGNLSKSAANYFAMESADTVAKVFQAFALNMTHMFRQVSIGYSANEAWSSILSSITATAKTGYIDKTTIAAMASSLGLGLGLLIYEFFAKLGITPEIALTRTINPLNTTMDTAETLAFMGMMLGGVDLGPKNTALLARKAANEVGGVLSGGFTPYITDYLRKKDDDARHISNLLTTGNETPFFSLFSGISKRVLVQGENGLRTPNRFEDMQAKGEVTRSIPFIGDVINRYTERATTVAKLGLTLPGVSGIVSAISGETVETKNSVKNVLWDWLFGTEFRLNVRYNDFLYGLDMHEARVSEIAGDRETTQDIIDNLFQYF